MCLELQTFLLELCHERKFNVLHLSSMVLIYLEAGELSPPVISPGNFPPRLSPPVYFTCREGLVGLVLGLV